MGDFNADQARGKRFDKSLVDFKDTNGVIALDSIKSTLSATLLIILIEKIFTIF